MIFTPLIEEKEIAEAFKLFCNSMKEGTTPFPSFLAYRRYPEKEKKRCVCWNKSLGIWSHFYPDEKLYWCPFGLQDPSTASRDTSKPPRLNITCEINFPHEGISRANGLFVQDDKNIYVTHKGNVGGGAKGISGSLFRRYVQRKNSKDIIDVTWPDGEVTETICIGRLCDSDRLKDPELPRKVANFVNIVKCFKDDIKEKRDGRPS
jgi:hypothetical protein